MATKEAWKKAAQLRRKKRIRKKISGSSICPRLVITRSLKHISATLIDDDKGVALTGIFDGVLKKDEYPLPVPKKDDKKAKSVLSGKVATAYRVGLAIAAVGKERGIERVVFDRNGLRYHGRVRALAEGARKGGLVF
ncbi:MAG: 50S ribosomal protein L18 [Candidatus Electryonea clarkiae]|nr:50S ribosomal protein L18 [Candidatus Electryonea clarkiae]MDP8288611.1 50S ribosomal protein L18 [Candidatus Electryonea clarkiae]